MTSEVLHTTIHNQCATCCQLFWPGETLVTLVYRNSELEKYTLLFTGIGQYCEQQTEKQLHALFCRRPECQICLRRTQLIWTIPECDCHAHRQRGVYNLFCKRALCPSCRAAEESVSVHTDCLELFERHCKFGREVEIENKWKKDEMYRRLWLAGTRQYAWREMEPPKFPSSTTLVMPPAELISQLCGFERIFLPEVIQVIQSHMPSSLIWRYCATIQLAQRLAAAMVEEPVTYEAPKVLSWSRGGLPVLVGDGCPAGSFIRFTIDCRGIKSIDRFSETLPSSAGEMPAHSCVFVVEPVERLADATIEFELGMCRLRLPSELRVAMWSTPNPLQLLKFTSHSPYDNRFSAISLDPAYCTGISFFMTSQVVREIYAHSSRHSTHVERFQHLQATYNRGVAWIYMPITAQDKITGIEIRKNVTIDRPHHFIIWTKTGKIIVGTPERTLKAKRGQPITNRSDRGILYEIGEDARRPLNLIHSVSATGLMSFIGTDADNQTESTEPDINPQKRWPLPRAFFSSASLEDVLNVHVFNDKRHEVTKGILFEYENGSKRAVGQCRLGWDQVRSWRRPLSMFYETDYCRCVDPKDVLHPVDHETVRVTFDSESSHVTEDGTLETNFYAMKGCLNFWFLVNDVRLEIVGA